MRVCIETSTMPPAAHVARFMYIKLTCLNEISIIQRAPTASVVVYRTPYLYSPRAQGGGKKTYARYTESAAADVKRRNVDEFFVIKYRIQKTLSSLAPVRPTRTVHINQSWNAHVYRRVQSDPSTSLLRA